LVARIGSEESEPPGRWAFSEVVSGMRRGRSARQEKGCACDRLRRLALVGAILCVLALVSLRRDKEMFALKSRAVSAAITQCWILRNEKQLSFEAFAKLLVESDELDDLMSKAVAESPFEALFFESIPVVGNAAAITLFEFVLVNSPSLAKVQNADVNPFRSHLQAQEGNVARFTNLGGDAELCVPVPNGSISISEFRHIAPFFRASSLEQSREVWKCVGKIMLDTWENNSGKKKWLSTSGLGVFFLHFRWDDQPKYYTFEPYRNG